jgi:hypothetical protein
MRERQSSRQKARATPRDGKFESFTASEIAVGPMLQMRSVDRLLESRRR